METKVGKQTAQVEDELQVVQSKPQVKQVNPLKKFPAIHVVHCKVPLKVQFEQFEINVEQDTQLPLLKKS